MVEVLDGKLVVLGVTGGIAAYKAADLARRLIRDSAEVRVIMTHAATRFISPLTMQTLSQNPVASDMFERPARWEPIHIDLATAASVVVVAPATANAIAKFAHGLADDLLSATVLAALGRGVPLVVAPAMNQSMLRHPATRDNLARLRSWGADIVESESGELACGEMGSGRLAEVETIHARIREVLGRRRDFAGVRALVTAGPTREHIDDVRFLSNPSSGRMGYALAEELLARGAEVTLITGPVALIEPHGASVVRVQSADDMAHQALTRAGETDVVFMAAAVADFRPVRRRPGKAPKGDVLGEGPLRLEPTIDILAALAGQRKERSRPVLVGFAAASGDVTPGGEKVTSKGADLVVANDISAPDSGFDVDTNRVTLFFRDGRREDLPLLSKRETAARICDRAVKLL